MTGSAHNWPLVGSLQCRQRLSRLCRMESLHGEMGSAWQEGGCRNLVSAACGVQGLESKKGRIYFPEFLSGSFNTHPTQPLLTRNRLLENKSFQSSGMTQNS